MNQTVMADCTPNLGAKEKAKVSFYDNFQHALDRVPSGNLLIVAGNAKRDAVDMAARHILGKLSLGPMSANGYRLINFASTIRFVVFSPHFQQPRRHIVIWLSSEGRNC